MPVRLPLLARREHFVAALALSLCATASHAAPIEWVAGTGDWFDASNWNPAQVPVGFGGGTAGDDASINNGGTAQADVATAPAGALVRGRTISVGAGDAPGAISGGLQSSGVGLEVAFGVRVGVAAGSTTGATGAMSVTGADVDAGGTEVVVGAVLSTLGASTADGAATIAGGRLDAARISVGAVSFDALAATASPAASAVGALEVDDGTLGNVLVGSNFGGGAGTSANGILIVNDGNLDPRGNPGISVGRTFAPIDPLLVGGSAVGEVIVRNGSIVLADPLNAGASPQMELGVADGGDARGTLRSAGMDMAGNHFGASIVGQARRGGAAAGRLESGGGDLIVSDEVAIGRTFADTGGTAEGFADFGPGATVRGLDGAASGFTVGNTRAYGLLNNIGLGTAAGEAIAHGVEGFDSYRIGVVEGTIQQAGISASGRLVVGAGGIGGNAAGDSAMYVGASSGIPNNGQVIGPGGLAQGELIVDGGDVTGFAGIFVGSAEPLFGAAGTGIGSAIGVMELNGGNLSTETLVVGRASYSRSPAVDGPDANPAADGSFAMTGGTLTVEAPPFGSLLNTATLDVGVARSFNSAIPGDPNPDLPNQVHATGRVSLDGVTVPGNANLQIGVALGFDQGATVADGEMIVQGGSVQVGSLAMGQASGSEERARARFELTDSSLEVTGDAVVGRGGDAHATLSANRTDVTVGGGLFVGTFRQFDSTGTLAPMQANMVVSGASLEVGGDLVVGAQLQGGNGALQLTDVDAQVGGSMRLGASSNLGTLFGDGRVALARSTMTVSGDAMLDAGTLSLLDSRLSVAGNLRTEFFAASSTPPGYADGASADSEILLRRSLLAVGQEFALGVDDLLQIAIEGPGRGIGYGAVDAATVALLGGTLWVDFVDFENFSGALVFDLIVSGGIDGITGDFASVGIHGLASGYAFSAGVVIDDIGSGPVEIYRLQLARQVPEPPTVVCIALGLLGIAVARGKRRAVARRARNAQSRHTTSS